MAEYRDSGRGERIRALRVASGLSLQQLATLVGSDKSTVQRWEQGGDFFVRFLPAMCGALGTTERFLLTGESASARGGGAQQTAGYREFRAWLDASPYAALTKSWVLRELEAMAPERELSREHYAGLWHVFVYGTAPATLAPSFAPAPPTGETSEKSATPTPKPTRVKGRRR